MAVDEQHRLRLYEAVRRALGDEEAATLMEYLPPVGWADVATKHDLTSFRTEVQSEFAAVRSDLRGEMRSGFAEVRTDLHREVGAVHDALREQTTRLVTWMIPTWLSAVGIAVAVTQLG